MRLPPLPQATPDGAGVAEESLHPTRLRRSIVAAALVAVATWWGLGLPCSLYTWLLDSRQLRWVLICYAWEVPACGLFGPVLFPLLWFRRIERRWDQAFARPTLDPGEIAALEAALLDFPQRSAWVFLATSIVGYGVGALQVRLFAQLPMVEVWKILALGLATGLVGSLFALLYLERLLTPVLRRLGELRSVVPPAGRRVPLYVKVFASLFVLTLTALLLLGPILYSRSERILEREVGKRVLIEVERLAVDLGGSGAGPLDAAWWKARAKRMALGTSGSVYLVDADGHIVGGARPGALTEEGFRPAVTAAIRDGRTAVRVDRTYTPRIVAFAPLPGKATHVVAVVVRDEFAGELDRMLARGGVVVALTLVLALILGFLLSRRLIGPIEVVTRTAARIARTAHGPWERVLVRTNDEVGELATTFNQMTERLEEVVAREQTAREDAEAANRTKDEFLATLSHELRTPLQAILSWAALLRSGRLAGPGTERALETIERSTRHQARLIDDLLDISRIETGKLEIERASVDLAEVIRAAVEDWRPAAEGQRITLGATLAGNLVVLGDARRLRQIVSNLLSNAVKFTPADGRVEVDCARALDRAVVRVTDSGEGIPTAFLPRVFDRFSQGGSAVRRRAGGLGLGLAIVRHLVESHGGTVEATSQGPGRGATFTVSLPLAVGAGAVADTSESAEAPDALAGLAILVVEDDPDVRDALALMLAGAGAHPTAVASAEEALAACERAWPNALVSDIDLPEVDGYSLLARLQALDGGRAPLPAVAVTGLAGGGDRERVYAAGFAAHLPKPVDPGTLIRLLATLCARGPTESGPRRARERS